MIIAKLEDLNGIMCYAASDTLGKLEAAGLLSEEHKERLQRAK